VEAVIYLDAKRNVTTRTEAVWAVVTATSRSSLLIA
jgi:hypothetical protein